MSATFDPALRSWVDYHTDSDFPIQNIPFGICSRLPETKPFAASRIGDHVIDLAALSRLGAFEGLAIPEGALSAPFLNDLIALGKVRTNALRGRIQEILTKGSPFGRLTDSREEWLLPVDQVTNHLPVRIGDYTDFYSSIEHATNVGMMFRDPAEPLLPNWKHLPVGYHGRASSIRLTGHSFHRPTGQLKPEDGPPVHGATRLLDFELEMAFIIGTDTELGDRIPVDRAEEHIFGLALFNDWSARDIQRWEYVPLGPFLAKNFASTMSAWIVTIEALEPFRTAGPSQDPEVLPYLRSSGKHNFDLDLEVLIQPEKESPSTVCRSNFRYMYWSMAQQLAHHTVNGCDVHVGDVCASGTISGPTPDSYGSMLELSWKGTREVPLAGGKIRKFIQDGDTVILRGHGEREGVRIGFGDCAATVLPAKPI